MNNRNLVKRRFGFPGLWILLLACMSPAPSALAAESTISLQRATITVSDLDASTVFYRDLLGFTVNSRTAYDTPVLRTMFHLPEGSNPELVLLDSTAQPRALALVSADGVKVDAAANRQNAPALVLTINDMDSAHARLTEAGVEVLVPPTSLMGFSGKPIGREAAYFDPDGIRVVLFELTAN